jgi:hypothetical protein
MKVGGDGGCTKAKASIGGRWLVSISCDMGLLSMPSIGSGVMWNVRLRIVPMADMSVIDVLSEVPRVVQPTVHVIHSTIHIANVLVGLSDEGVEVAIQLNHLLIEYLVHDIVQYIMICVIGWS